MIMTTKEQNLKEKIEQGKDAIKRIEKIEKELKRLLRKYNHDISFDSQ